MTQNQKMPPLKVVAWLTDDPRLPLVTAKQYDENPIYRLMCSTAPLVLRSAAEAALEEERAGRAIERELAEARANDAADLVVRLSDAEASNQALLQEVEGLRKDAERYRWLRDQRPCEFSLTRNGDHACNYMSAAQWIDSHPEEIFGHVDPEEIQRMKDTDTIWHLQIYPDTPIGFYVWDAASLDKVIDAAIDSARGEGER